MRIRGVVLLVIVAMLQSSCKGRLFPASQANLSSQPAASGSSQEAAQTGLATLKSLITQDNYQGMGFTSVDQVKDAQLGSPMKLYLVPLDALTAYKGDTGAAALLQDGHKLIYPVAVNQQVLSSLSVTQQNDGWRATDFGNSAITRALVAHRQSQDDFVVWVPALKIYFTARGAGDALVFTPVMDDPRFGFKAGEAVPASRGLTILQQGISGYNGLPQ